MNYCVSIVYQKTLDNGINQHLVSGLVKANSAHEALGIAMSYRAKDWTVSLTSSIRCDSDGLTFLIAFSRL